MTIYQGVNGVNREIKQIFQGVAGVNREIKERWEGVSGVNRKVFSSGIVLYNFGDECTNITGGWKNAYCYNQYTVSKLNSIYITAIGSGYSSGSVVPTNKIDISNHNKLMMQFNGLLHYKRFSGGTIVLCVTDSINTFLQNTAIAKTYVRPKTSVDLTGTSLNNSIIEVDISGISGSHYIGVELYKDNEYTDKDELMIKKVWLE